MKTLILKRHYGKESTTGYITLENGTSIESLERPWLNNQVGISCIPEGEYIVHRDLHGRHTWFAIEAVEGRTFIEIHVGHKVQHSLGCILFDVIALQDLLLDTKGESFKLIIQEG